MRKVILLLGCALALAVPTAVMAQSTTGSIAGLVRDTTGAVLPGVTVEAASPALIEKVRTAVTDAQGNYKIVDLRPGTYTVTASLPGFGTFKREGLELTTGFTATVNAELKVGSLEETVTVTGASPVVDVQNVRQQTVLSREMLDTLPTGKAFQAFTALTLGAVQTTGQQDVGGNQGELYAPFVVHGNRGENRLMIDGMQMHGMDAAANGKHIFVNQAAVQEITLGTGAASAELEVGGAQMNVVPKDGGNSLSGSGLAQYSGPRLQTTNLTDQLKSRGLNTTVKIRKVYDYGVGVGGPIASDKVWFYTAHRWWGAQNNVPGNYFNATPATRFYTPDLSRPAYTDNYQQAHDVRLTAQVTSKQKLTFHTTQQDNCNCYFDVDNPVPRSPDGVNHVDYKWQRLYQGTWSYPRTNRLLFEGGFGYLSDNETNRRTDNSSPDAIAYTELSTGLRYGAKTDGLNTTSLGTQPAYVWTQRAAVSYVTGSHALKVGMTALEAKRIVFNELNSPPIMITLRNGLPVSITQWASPSRTETRIRPNLGIYAQDQWTVSRLTLNLGMRFDYFNGNVPEQTRPAGPFAAALHVNEINGVPNWKDITPRIGGAYDLFGNGKTAIKGSIGRYVANETTGVALNNNPAQTVVQNATRVWTDANGDFVPNCDLTNIAANGECQALNNRLFGTPFTNTTYDPSYLKGWGVRGYQWQAVGSVQQELRPGLALNVGVYRTWWGNFTTTLNRAVTNADFDQYCVTAPTEAAFGDTSGKQLCGLYDVKPAAFGRVDNYIVPSKTLGKQIEQYDGIDVGMQARFGKGGSLTGGFNTGRQLNDNCDIVKNNLNVGFALPRTDDFCRNVNGIAGQTQYKFSGSYPLPWWGIQASATFQNLPGLPLLATTVFTNAQIAPSLGRNLAAGAGGTVNVQVTTPQYDFGDRLNQLDLRFIKNIRIGKARIRGMFDAYNVLNASTILRERQPYGPTWRQPTAILGARMFKFGIQTDF